MLKKEKRRSDVVIIVRLVTGIQTSRSGGKRNSSVRRREERHVTITAVRNTKRKKIPSIT